MFAGAGAIFVKVLWHDALGMSLYAKRLEHGEFISALANRWRHGLTSARRSSLHA